MERGLLLDVVVGKCSTILQLLTGENETLLVRRYSLLVLNLCLNIIDGIRTLDLESYGLPGKRFHEDLHIVAVAGLPRRRGEIDRLGLILIAKLLYAGIKFVGPL